LEEAEGRVFEEKKKSGRIKGVGGAEEVSSAFSRWVTRKQNSEQSWEKGRQNFFCVKRRTLKNGIKEAKGLKKKITGIYARRFSKKKGS